MRSEPIRVQVNDPVSPTPFAVPEPSPAGTDAEVESAFDRLGTSPGDEEVVFRPAKPVYDDAEARLPPSAQRTGAKLMVTDPKIPGGPGLDLASVAESGIEDKASPPASPRQDRAAQPQLARPRSWRDDSFGPYQLVDRVAIGGMAEVFKAKRAGVAGFEKDHPVWMEADRGWLARAARGPGVRGGPEGTRTAYFYGSGFFPYGATWGPMLGKGAGCASPSPSPSLDPCASPDSTCRRSTAPGSMWMAPSGSGPPPCPNSPA